MLCISLKERNRNRLEEHEDGQTQHIFPPNEPGPTSNFAADFPALTPTTLAEQNAEDAETGGACCAVEMFWVLCLLLIFMEHFDSEMLVFKVEPRPLYLYDCKHQD